jgi:hypothetical protein
MKKSTEKQIRITGWGILPAPMLMELRARADDTDFNTRAYVFGTATKELATGRAANVVELCLFLSYQEGIEVHSLAPEDELNRVKRILAKYSDNPDWLCEWEIAPPNKLWDVTVRVVYEFGLTVSAPYAAQAEHIVNGYDIDDLDLHANIDVNQPDDWHTYGVEEMD